MNKKQLQRLYSIATSISILVAALCLMGACLYILFSGHGFSRDTVAVAFHAVSLPVYICPVLVVLGFLPGLSAPPKSLRRGIARQDWLILRRLQRKADLSHWDDARRSAVLKERRTRSILRGISLVIPVIGCAAFGGYLFSGDRFLREDLPGAAVGCVMLLAPFLMLYLTWILFSGPIYAESCRREIDLLKSSVPPGANQPRRTGDKTMPALRLFLLVIAVSFIAFGFFTGGFRDVLTKAVNICTECIGLG